jgi:MerR family transcriptional regulator, heat shock protein HspR
MRKRSGPLALIRGPDGRVRDERLREEPRTLMPSKRSSDEARTFLISVAAELAGMHAQTLRTYDRLGLVRPRRTSGGGRRYSEHDVDLLREVQRLSQDEGVNLAGIKRIIELTNQVDALRARVRELSEEVEALRAQPRAKSTALVVWQPRSKR